MHRHTYIYYNSTRTHTHKRTLTNTQTLLTLTLSLSPSIYLSISFSLSLSLSFSLSIYPQRTTRACTFATFPKPLFKPDSQGQRPTKFASTLESLCRNCRFRRESWHFLEPPLCELSIPKLPAALIRSQPSQHPRKVLAVCFYAIDNPKGQV